MMITDEMLSAYLDNELSAADRIAVQNGLRDDPAVAARLAQLTRVNTLVGRQAALIDTVAMPAAVMAMLQTKPAASSNVVAMSGFRRVQQRLLQQMREHAALAASLALLAGFAGGQLLPFTGEVQLTDDTGSAAFTALETLPSGQTLTIDGDTRLTARFSFVDPQARYCRQYVIENSQGSSENLACRGQSGWVPVASVYSNSSATGQYQTASGPAMLDTLLDTMMQGPALSQAAEQNAISRHWQAE